MSPFKEGLTRGNVKKFSDSPRPSTPPPAPRPFYGPIVWLEVDGELKKCRVSEDAGAHFRQLAGQISVALRALDHHAEADALIKERTRVASEIVERGEYEVWQ